MYDYVAYLQYYRQYAVVFNLLTIFYYIYVINLQCLFGSTFLTQFSLDHVIEDKIGYKLFFLKRKLFVNLLTPLNIQCYIILLFVNINYCFLKIIFFLTQRNLNPLCITLDIQYNLVLYSWLQSIYIYISNSAFFRSPTLIHRLKLKIIVKNAFWLMVNMIMERT